MSWSPTYYSCWAVPVCSLQHRYRHNVLSKSRPEYDRVGVHPRTHAAGGPRSPTPRFARDVPLSATTTERATRPWQRPVPSAEIIIIKSSIYKRLYTHSTVKIHFKLTCLFKQYFENSADGLVASMPVWSSCAVTSLYSANGGAPPPPCCVASARAWLTLPPPVAAARLPQLRC